MVGAGDGDVIQRGVDTTAVVGIISITVIINIAVAVIAINVVVVAADACTAAVVGVTDTQAPAVV